MLIHTGDKSSMKSILSVSTKSQMLKLFGIHHMQGSEQ